MTVSLNRKFVGIIVLLSCLAFYFLGVMINRKIYGSGLSDVVWVQQRTIKLNTSDFETCVVEAARNVSGVEVIDTAYDAVDIELNVKLAKPIPHMGVNVQHRNDGTAVIMFTGGAGGTSESAEERAEITPLLNAITSAVQKRC